MEWEIFAQTSKNQEKRWRIQWIDDLEIVNDTKPQGCSVTRKFQINLTQDI